MIIHCMCDGGRFDEARRWMGVAEHVAPLDRTGDLALARSSLEACYGAGAYRIHVLDVGWPVRRGTAVAVGCGRAK